MVWYVDKCSVNKYLRKNIDAPANFLNIWSVPFENIIPRLDPLIRHLRLWRLLNKKSAQCNNPLYFANKESSSISIQPERNSWCLGSHFQMRTNSICHIFIGFKRCIKSVWTSIHCRFSQVLHQASGHPSYKAAYTYKSKVFSRTAKQPQKFKGVIGIS